MLPSQVVGGSNDVLSGAADRFEIRRQLGAGGMGVVYEAFDREHGQLVALKTLPHLDPSRLQLFKREFRTLADLGHRNLVRLHELISVGDDWFFTMDLVIGVDFLSFVSRSSPDLDDADSLASNAPEHSITADLTPRAAAIRQVSAPPAISCKLYVDLDTLRETTRQLAEGVHALHAAGRLHRDLKPSNVLVTADGRVVICDFGLVTELEDWRPYPSVDRAIGTVAYAAPEQAALQPVGSAGDWYSVGVMLYEALTRQLPFAGNRRDVIQDKQRRGPRPPSELVLDVPDDLDTLATDLLRWRPEDRPAGRDVLRRLGGRSPRVRSVSSTITAPFVGRTPELRTLEEAYETTQHGRPVAVYLHGESGMGKSAVLRHFLERKLRAGATVLHGRCYERETVPYKAMDSVIDTLTAYLVRHSAAELARILPDGVSSLARLFPVLRRVEGVPEPPPRAFETLEPQEVRRRGFLALRQLLAKLSERAPLIVAIDDAQWGDLDSAELLLSILDPPSPPGLLLIVSYRSKERETSKFLSALRRSKSGIAEPCTVREVTVEALASADAEQLATHLVDARELEAGRTIARESGGNPLFVYELVRAMRGGRPSGPLSLDDVLRSRVLELPEQPRRLLTILAAAGNPLSVDVALRAAEIEPADREALVILHSEHLVRSKGGRNRDQVEIVHDRIREAALVLASDTLAACHRHVAKALIAVGNPDPIALADHLLAGGELERAAHYAELAADRAAEALAFDRAVHFYRVALDHGRHEIVQGSALRRRLADALVNAGRGPEAARDYMLAAEGANTADALELRRCAAEQLLRYGHFDEGLATVRDVLAAVGLELAPSRRRALIRLVWRRIKLRLRGFRFTRRDETQVATDTLRRIDICWSVASGLSLIDPVQAQTFQAEHLLLALKAGEPYRVARGVALEIAFVGTKGVPQRARTDRLIALATQLAAETRRPHNLGVARAAAGIAALLQGRWRDARDLCTEAELIFRDQCRGVAWELASARFFRLNAQFFLGELAQLSRELRPLLAEAEQRGDFLAATGLRNSRVNVVWLCRDDPDEARRQAQQGLVKWSHSGFQLQHFYDIISNGYIDLYEGNGRIGWDRLRERWQSMRLSLVFRIQTARVQARHLRARLALAIESPPAALLRRALADARSMHREGAAWSRALAKLIVAAVDFQRGRLERALAGLDAAEGELVEADMFGFAQAARWCRGHLVGGDAGNVLKTDVESWFRDQGVVRPDRMIAMLVPGFARGRG